MSAWMVWLAMVAALSAALLWGMRREFDRLEREARIKALLRPLTESFSRMKVALGVALLPAMREMVTAAIEAQSAMERLNAQLRDGLRAKDDA